MTRKSRRGGERGQYMIEFGLSLIFFVGVTVGVIEIILMTYDYNLAQRASWEAARKVAIGQSNAQVLQFVDDVLVGGWISTVALQARPDFNANTLITPNDQVDRTEGSEGTVNFGMRFGVSFPFLGEVNYRLPATSRLTIVAKNDEDRDGFHDALEFPFLPGDHDNDGLSDFADPDDDNDGSPDVADFITMTHSGGMTVNAVHTGLGTLVITTDDHFHMPAVWTLTDGVVTTGTQREPHPLFARDVPRNYFNGTLIPITLDASFNADNDLFEDKFDEAPMDPNDH